MQAAKEGHTFRDAASFQAGLAEVCGAYRITPHGSDFSARAALRRCGGLEMATVSLGNSVVERDRGDIRRDHTDHFVLSLQCKGQALISQEDSHVRLREGDYSLTDACQPSSFVFDRDRAEQICVHLSRSEVTERFGATARGGLCIRREDDLAVAMTALLRRAMNASAPGIDEAFLTVLGSWLQEAAQTSASRRADAGCVLRRALQLIDDNYRDCGFGPGELAVRLGVSPRSLQRAFAGLGESPRERILRRRLERARLELGQRGSRTVTDVALGVGFNDISYFYSRFRDRFGHAPGQTAHADA